MFAPSETRQNGWGSCTFLKSLQIHTQLTDSHPTTIYRGPEILATPPFPSSFSCLSLLPHSAHCGDPGLGEQNPARMASIEAMLVQEAQDLYVLLVSSC